MRVDAETTYGNKLWYLVHCQTRKETFAANSLMRILNLQVFLPESQFRSHGVIKHVPFFPGYIFTYMDLQQIPRSLINTCPGVLRLVEFGGSPQAVPQSVIDTIAQQLSRQNGLHAHTSHNFSPGDSVQMKHGPLRDLEMIFVGQMTPSGRVSVLLGLLGRLKEVQIDASLLEKAPTKYTGSHQSSPQRERYTLLKGPHRQH